MAIETVCDECGTIFTPDFKEVKAKDNNTKTIFVCPECQHEYLSFVTNGNVKEKQKEIQKLYGEVRLALAAGKGRRANKILREIDKIQDEVNQEMSELKEKEINKEQTII